MSDLFLWLLCGAFVGWEGFAHYVARNRSAHTLSNRVWALERLIGWLARVLVGAGTAALFLHLTFHLF